MLAALRQSYHNISIILIACILMSLEPYASLALQFDRSAILHTHAYWRLLTGNFVHLSLTHLGMNVLGFSLVVIIFIREQRPLYDALAFLFIAVFSNLLMLTLSPNILLYVGLSGVIHGYFVYYLAVGSTQTPFLCFIGWLGTAGKVIMEQQPNYDGSKTADLIGGAVAYDAHLYGFVCGCLLGLTILAHRFLRQRHTHLTRKQPAHQRAQNRPLKKNKKH